MFLFASKKAISTHKKRLHSAAVNEILGFRGFYSKAPVSPEIGFISFRRREKRKRIIYLMLFAGFCGRAAIKNKSASGRGCRRVRRGCVRFFTQNKSFFGSFQTKLRSHQEKLQKTSQASPQKDVASIVRHLIQINGRLFFFAPFLRVLEASRHIHSQKAARQLTHVVRPQSERSERRNPTYRMEALQFFSPRTFSFKNHPFEMKNDSRVTLQ